MSSTTKLKKLYTEKVRGRYYCIYPHRNSECPNKHRGFASSHDCLRHLNGILTHDDTADDDDSDSDGVDDHDDDDGVVAGSKRKTYSAYELVPTLRIPPPITPIAATTPTSSDAVPALVPAVAKHTTPRSAPMTPTAMPPQQTYSRDTLDRQQAAPAVVVESTMNWQRRLPADAAPPTVPMDIEQAQPRAVARAQSADTVVTVNATAATSASAVGADTPRTSDSLLSLAQLALDAATIKKQNALKNAVKSTAAIEPIDTDNVVSGAGSEQSSPAGAVSALVYTTDGGPMAMIPPEARKWRCSQCGRTYGTRSHLGRHRRTHLPLRQYTCRFATAGYPCSKPQFNDVSNLKKHMEEVHCGWARPTPREDRISDVELFGICINTKVKRIAMPPIRNAAGLRITTPQATSLLTCDVTEFPAALQPQPQAQTQNVTIAAM